MNKTVETTWGEFSSWWVLKIVRVFHKVRESLRLLRPRYPEWKHLIPEKPTLEQAKEAWKILTRCQIEMYANWEVLTSFVWTDKDVEILSKTQISCNWEIYTLDQKTWFKDGIGVYYNQWYNPEECDIQWTHSDNIGNEWFTATLPNGTTMHYSWFTEYTDKPNTREDFFYRGEWASWSIDDDGNRFYKIDEGTQLPQNWEEAEAEHVFRNFVMNVACWDMKKLIWNS